jgi:hypothetical protein
MNVFEKAMITFGETAQIDMTIEECAELIVTLNKLKRGLTLQHFVNVCEEVIDVEIMINQLKEMLPNTMTDVLKEEKMSRLEELIKLHKS